MSFLSATGMTGGYGGSDILHDCTITVEKGEIAVVVGPNGAGKSTAMKAVFGMLNLREGSVVLDGKDITNLAPQERVPEGMGFVPQNRNVFVSMTVEENLDMGPSSAKTTGLRKPSNRFSICFQFLAKNATNPQVSFPVVSVSRLPLAGR
ncbi:ATP-binding cassette domain-containing protein [Thalassospira indica]|uniref:ATP-binding cassette domain-containing protein n=1 Tax=Thalassospira indica TaxID=1891279 RepID=UPI001FE5DFDA|nr:ATP-binding cassette domain-containing protein [Thalassospira indica]